MTPNQAKVWQWVILLCKQANMNQVEVWPCGLRRSINCILVSLQIGFLQTYFEFSVIFCIFSKLWGLISLLERSWAIEGSCLWYARCLRGPLEIGLIHEFLQGLHETTLWKSPFYYAKMGNFWSEVRIPDFPS